MFIKEERFSGMNLTDGSTFLTAMIKLEKYTFNQKIYIYTQHKETHTINCKKEWLEHTDFPDIA